MIDTRASYRVVGPRRAADRCWRLDYPSPARVSAGCPADEREKLVARCDAAIAYLASIKDAINDK